MTSRFTTFTILGASTLMTACFFLGKGPSVPAASAGDIPLTVVNNSDRDIFLMGMWPDDAPIENTNWLGEGSRRTPITQRGGTHQFSVKPNAYRVLFAVTDIYGQENMRYLATTYAKEAPMAKPPIQIKGPTRLVIGEPLAPTPGVATITLPLIDTYGTAKANCLGDGVPAQRPDDCCSLLQDPKTGRCAQSTD